MTNNTFILEYHARLKKNDQGLYVTTWIDSKTYCWVKKKKKSKLQPNKSNISHKKNVCGEYKPNLRWHTTLFKPVSEKLKSAGEFRTSLHFHVSLAPSLPLDISPFLSYKKSGRV